MPYSGPDDPGLPERVKQLPTSSRRRFVGAWNGAYDSCRSRGDPDCEGYAFRVANAAIRSKGAEVSEKEMHADEGAMRRAMRALQSAMAAMRSMMGGGDGHDEAAAKAASLSQRVNAVGAAVSRRYPDGPGVPYQAYVWPREVLDDSVTVEQNGQLFQIGYAIDNKGVVTLADELVPVSIEYVAQKAVWSTAFVNDLPDSAFLYVEPGGEKDDEGKTKPRSLRHFPYRDADGAIDLPHVRNAIARAPQSNLPESVVSSVQARARRLLGSKAGTVAIQKDAKGAWRWLATVSNRFRDRDGEILTDAAHKEFAAAIEDGSAEKPDLWLAHVPGTKIGKSDLVTYADGFLLASGTFDDEGVAERLASMSEGLGVSHHFVGEKSRDLITYYRMDEISVLPHEWAANPWTGFEAVQKGDNMSINTNDREFLVAVLGEEKTAEVESGLADRAAELKTAGVDFKSAGGDASPKAPTIEDAIKRVIDVEGLSDMLKQQRTTLGEMNAVLGETVTALKGLSKRMEALERSDDQKVADVLAPRSQSDPVWKGFRASQDSKTVITAKDADAAGKPQAEWLDEIMGGLIESATVR